MNFKLLKTLVSIPSTYPDEYQLGKLLMIYLKNLGFSVITDRIQSKRFNILATRGISPQVLFYGHLDTTHSDKLPGWNTPPFSLTQEGKKLKGLGVLDMKGGIFAFLEAARNTSTPLKILLAVDEENISQGCWSVIKNQKQFFKEIKLIISPEPNFGLGDFSITTTRTGRVIFDVNFTGRSAHIALYHQGEDAIAKSVEFMNKYYTRRHKLFRSPDTISQIRKISAEAVGMSVPAASTLEIEVLLGWPDSLESAQSALQKLTPTKVAPHPRATPYLPGYSFKKFPYESEISKVIKKHVGRNMKIVKRSSVADDNVLSTLKIPVITWGPSGGKAHAPNEYIEIESLKNFVLMYTDLLLSLGNLVK